MRIGILPHTFLAACGESVTAPEPRLDDADIEFLTQEADAALTGLLDGLFASDSSGPWGALALAGPTVTTYTFERSRDCRAGGTVTLAGSGSSHVGR